MSARDEQLGLGLRVPSRPLRLSRNLRDIPVDTYRLPRDGRKWRSRAQDRMVLAGWLATHGDADGSRIWPAVASIMRHFGWSRRKVFYLLADLKELQLMESGGLTREHGNRVRRMNLRSFLGAGVQDSAGAGVHDSRALPGAGVHDSRAGVQSNVAPNRHLTDTKDLNLRPGRAVENSTPQNPAAQTAASSPVPLSTTKNRRLLPQQTEYARVSRLIAGALWIGEKAKASRTRLDYSSWKEDLKQWAVENAIPYDADSIAKALDLADRKTSGGPAAVAGSRR